MPDREVGTVRELIFYQYAKIIAKRAVAEGDAARAKRRHYGFIKKTFHDLRDGAISWSEITREDWQLVESDRRCAYCGSDQGLHHEHVVPRSLRVKPDCEYCERLLGIHNQVLACADCNRFKGARGLYEFYRSRFPEDAKYYDRLPPLVEKKYLKTIYACHECAGTLDTVNPSRDGAVSVADIDFIVRPEGASRRA